MKKIIVLFLIVATLVSCFSSNVSAIPLDLEFSKEDNQGTLTDDVAGSQFKNQIELVSNIGLIERNSNDAFKPDALVTRIMLAKAVLKVAGVNFSEKDENSIIETAATGGLIKKGIASSKVTMKEVAFSAVTVLGGKAYAEVKGGYPNGYLLIANEKRLFDNIKVTQDGAITIEQLACVLYNTLLSPYYEISSITQNETKVEENKDVNILQKIFNIWQEKGIVTADGIKSLYPNDVYQNDTVEINRTKYFANRTKAYDYLGQYVIAFIKKDKDLSLNKIISFWLDDKKNNILNIVSDDIIGLDGINISYEYNDTNNKKARVSSEARIVYNGIYVATASNDNLEKYLPRTGYIKLIDNNNDGLFDVIVITDYLYYVADRSPGESEYIVFKYGSKFKELNYIEINKSSNDAIYEVYKDGIITSLKDIKEWDILAICSSRNTVGKKYIRVDVSSSELKDIIIDEIKNENDNTIIVANKKEYLLTPEYVEAAGLKDGSAYDLTVDKPEIGNKVTLRLSLDGRVGAIIGTGNVKFAYLVNVDTPKGLSSSGKIKLFTYRGKIEIFEMPSKINFYSSSEPQGKRIDDYIAIEKFFNSDKSINRCLIAYKTNEENLLTDIYLQLDNTNGVPGQYDYPLTFDFYQAGLTSGTRARYYMGMINSKYRIKTAIPLFVVPPAADANDESLYAIKAINSYSNDFYYPNIKLYAVDRFFNAGVAVYEGSNSDAAAYDTPSVIVSKVVRTVLEDGSVGNKIYFWQGDILMSKVVSDEKVQSKLESGWIVAKASELQFGDIIQYSVDISERINNFRLLFRTNNPGKFRIQRSTGTDTNGIMPLDGLVGLYGKVIGSKGDMVLINCVDDGTIPSNNIAVVLGGVAAYGTPRYYIVHKDIERISVASAANILQGDIVYMRKRYNSVIEVYILRN